MNLGPLRKILFAEALQRQRQDQLRGEQAVLKRSQRLGSGAPVRVQSAVRAAKRGKRNG